MSVFFFVQQLQMLPGYHRLDIIDHVLEIFAMEKGQVLMRTEVPIMNSGAGGHVCRRDYAKHHSYLKESGNVHRSHFGSRFQVA